MSQPDLVFNVHTEVGNVKVSTLAYFHVIDRIVVIDHFITGHEFQRFNRPAASRATARKIAQAVHEATVKETTHD